MIIERPDGKKIVIEGSGNFTYNMEADINAFLIHPENKEIYHTFKRANKHLIDESLFYTPKLGQELCKENVLPKFQLED